MPFLISDTLTPVSKRYCISLETVKQAAAFFLETGERVPNLIWEQI